MHLSVIPGFTMKMRLAVLDFKADGVSRATSRRISELIRVNMINSKKFLIIERAQMGKVLTEQGFQQSGCVEVGCAVKVGKLLSANKILVGTVMKLGNSMVLTARIVDVEKGFSEFSHDQKIESMNKLYKNVKEFTKDMSRKISGKGATVAEDEDAEAVEEEENDSEEKENIIDERTGNSKNVNYRDDGDYTIYDKRSGLKWMRLTSKDSFTYSEALQYASDCKRGGYRDWRLPSKKELLSLLPGADSSSIHFLKQIGFKNVKDYYYWTDKDNDGNAWVLELATDSFERATRRGKYRVILVRGKHK